MQASPELNAAVDALLTHYPPDQRRSALLMVLHAIQDTQGCISDEMAEWTAARLGISPIHVYEAVTFYPMYRRQPAGKFHIKICRTLSCELAGGRKLADELMQRLDLKTVDKVSEDNLVSFSWVECLAGCGTGPCMMINEEFCGNVTTEKLDQILSPITLLRRAATEKAAAEKAAAEKAALEKAAAEKAAAEKAAAEKAAAEKAAKLAAEKAAAEKAALEKAAAEKAALEKAAAEKAAAEKAAVEKAAKLAAEKAAAEKAALEKAAAEKAAAEKAAAEKAAKLAAEKAAAEKAALEKAAAEKAAAEKAAKLAAEKAAAEKAALEKAAAEKAAAEKAAAEKTAKLVAEKAAAEKAAAEKTAKLAAEKTAEKEAAVQGEAIELELAPAEAYNLGVSFFRKERFQDALAVFESCLQVDDLKMQAAYARCRCQEELGQDPSLPPELFDKQDELFALGVASNVACYLTRKGHQAFLRPSAASTTAWNIAAKIETSDYRMRVESNAGELDAWAWRKVEGRTIGIADPDENPEPTEEDVFVRSLMQTASTLSLEPLPKDGIQRGDPDRNEPI